MSKPNRCCIDFNILFYELDLALDKADFLRSENLIDELIEVAKEINAEDEKSQERIPKIRQ